ncbi:MAG: WD40 repeat domain-containing protein, partial [Gemmataceae bacterium]
VRGLPPLVTAAPVDIPAGHDKIGLLFRAGAKAVTATINYRIVATSGKRTAEQTARLNVRLVENLRSLAAPRNGALALFLPNSRQALVTGADGLLQIVDPESGKVLRTFANPRAAPLANCLALSKDGRFALSGHVNELVLWNVADGQPQRRYDLELVPRQESVQSVALAPDGRSALAATNYQLLLQDLTQGTRRRFSSLGGGRSALFSPLGNPVMAVSNKGWLELFDAGTLRETDVGLDRSRQAPLVKVNTAVFAPDGRTAAAAGRDRVIRIWDVRSGEETRRLLGHEATIGSLTYTADGRRRLSAGGPPDFSVYLWDVASGKEIKAFRKHKQPLVAAAFLAGGRQTLS